MIPDADALDRLNPAKLERRWKAEMDRFATHYHLDDAQRKAAADALANSTQKVDAWYRDGENRQKVDKYTHRVEQLHDWEVKRPATSFEIERQAELRKELDAERRELSAMVDGWTLALHDAWKQQVRPEQQKAAGPLPDSMWTSLDMINALTMYGLMAMGLCLMFGFLTPLAALAAAGFLTTIYLSMPPWPGIPAPTMVEGHYLIVNKNLVELLACLVIASTPNGRWLGLDALVFNWIGRRRAARRAEAGDRAPAPAGARA
ncbi:MAG TPA: DoxX family protein [Isosphaeraceae bacterium]|nr:DoxX family protein [Isosphaeraceae bacterium]